ncbi:unnamed protein product [Echinostoma caproni]|uniref:Fibrous sheath CABYR-binding protein-like n=1 Tax=Echinostoma caproni TaxID=27848 RepID=A0A183BC77_9TREM|nr:unnamed protein product [Echinostoma caproni]
MCCLGIKPDEIKSSDTNEGTKAFEGAPAEQTESTGNKVDDQEPVDDTQGAESQLENLQTTTTTDAEPDSAEETADPTAIDNLMEDEQDEPETEE